MKQFLAGTVFGLCAAAILLPAYAISANDGKSLDLFANALERVETSYIRDVGVGDLVDKALHGMLSALDPHSSYLNVKEMAALRGSDEYAGVGLELTMEEGVTKIITPIDGMPAAKAGILPGDFIMAIDGKPTDGLMLQGVIDMLQGSNGSKLTLTILRRSEGARLLTFTMIRSRVVIPSVRSEARGAIGYIRIIVFDQSTEAQLKTAMAGLKRQIGPGLKGYVVDLRNNAGGLLDTSVAISDDFLETGRIVSLRGRKPDDNRVYDAHSGDLADGKPVTVLINEGTAAGAEIMAGALQEQHRATILGMQSFGDGTIQTILPLDGGGALRLTTAQFYLGSGKPIQVAGITPDVAVAQRLTDGNRPTNRLPARSEEMLWGHLPGEAARAPVEIVYPDKQDADFQLSYALKRMNGS